MSVYDARYLARGWLSVAVASVADKDQPILSRTVAIERYPSGLRLIATDSYVLLRTWVPQLGHEDDPEPDLDEAPFARAIAMDPDGRGKGFMAYLLRQAAGDDAELIEVHVSLGVVDTSEDDLTLDGMDARWVVLDYPDHERLKLQICEGQYPDWRRIAAGFEERTTSVLALNPEIVGRLAKLGKLHGNAPLVWRFGGEQRMAQIEVGKAEPPVEGFVMPVRWDFNENRPADEVQAEKEAAEEEQREAEQRASDDDLVEEAKRIVVESLAGSETLLRRKLRINAAQASRVMGLLEKAGVVGPPNGLANRAVLLKPEDLPSVGGESGRVIEASAEEVAVAVGPGGQAPVRMGGIYQRTPAGPGTGEPE